MRSNKIDKAMRTLHASDDLYDRVLAESRQNAARARIKPGRLALRSIPVAIAAGIAVIALGGVTVSAISNSEFFANAFAPRGENGSDQASWVVPGGGDGTHEIPVKQEYRVIASEDVVDGLENEVETVGIKFEGLGLTMTVREMLADENGCGMVRFSLDCPDGLHLATEYGGPNEIVFDYSSENRFSTIRMECTNGIGLNSYSYYDAGTLTDTHLDGTMYFSPIGEIHRADGQTIGAASVLQGVKWCISGSMDATVASEAFKPSALVETREFSDQQVGISCYLSPFSIWFANHDAEDYRSLKLSLSDGAAWTVFEDARLNPDGVNVANTYVQSAIESHGSVWVLSGLVDPQGVLSITGIELNGSSTTERTYLPTY